MKLDVLLHTLLRPTAICVGVLFILWMVCTTTLSHECLPAERPSEQVALAMIAHRFLPSRALEIVRNAFRHACAASDALASSTGNSSCTNRTHMLNRSVVGDCSRALPPGWSV